MKKINFLKYNYISIFALSILPNKIINIIFHYGPWHISIRPVARRDFAPP